MGVTTLNLREWGMGRSQVRMSRVRGGGWDSWHAAAQTLSGSRARPYLHPNSTCTEPLKSAAPHRFHAASPQSVATAQRLTAANKDCERERGREHKHNPLTHLIVCTWAAWPAPGGYQSCPSGHDVRAPWPASERRGKSLRGEGGRG